MRTAWRTGVCRDCREASRDAIRWTGTGAGAQGWDQAGNLIVSVDPRSYRPAEVETLLGDASRAQRELGWKSRRSLSDLVKEMAEEDFKTAQRDALIKKAGFAAFNYHES